MTMRHWALRLAAGMALVATLALPVGAAAASYLLTGFVPELATPSVELFLDWGEDPVLGHDVTLASTGVRLSYVPYPALETCLDVRYLFGDAELAEGKDEGFGVDATIKYQVPQFLAGVDIAAALRVDFAETDSYSAYGSDLFGIISTEVLTGLTPFAGLGAGYNRQEVQGPVVSEWEEQIDPVLFVGARYMATANIGISAEASYREGFGLALSAGYRF